MNLPQAVNHKMLLDWLCGNTDRSGQLVLQRGKEILAEAFERVVQILDALLNSPYEKIIITDRDGNIIFINEAYAGILGRDRREVVGHHVLEILGQDTRMHIVGQTLKPELHSLFQTANRKTVARRIPLVSGDNVIGILGKDLFDNLDDFFTMAEKAKSARNLTVAGGWAKREFGHRARYGLDDIITADPHLQKIKETVSQAARTTSTILLQGETGVGKELFAHAIHRESNRARGPFVRVNCGAIPETLLESELFGYEEGAFTGARRGGKPGKFELADGGTIFLDEIGEISPVSQAKILRVLQEREIERVGGTATLPVDVRVVASTNRDLRLLAAEGKFRSDLFYRLNVVPVTIPALRERPGDIPLLAAHFVNKYNQAFGLGIKKVSDGALRRFRRYRWPGNVRELESVIEAAMNLVRDGETILSEFPHLSATEKEPYPEPATLKEALDAREAETVLAALESSGWDMEEAARTLDISLASLYRKINKHNLR